MPGKSGFMGMPVRDPLRDAGGMRLQDCFGQTQGMRGEGMSTIAIRLDPETRYKLEILAKASGQSRSVIVAEGVRRFVDACFAELVAKGGTAGEGGTENEGEGGTKPGSWNVIV